MENRASHYFDGFFKAQHLQSEVHMQSYLALVETKMGKFRIYIWRRSLLQSITGFNQKLNLFRSKIFFFLSKIKGVEFKNNQISEKRGCGAKPKRLPCPMSMLKFLFLRKNQINLAITNDFCKRVGLDFGDKVWSNFETKNLIFKNLGSRCKKNWKI